MYQQGTMDANYNMSVVVEFHHDSTLCGDDVPSNLSTAMFNVLRFALILFFPSEFQIRGK